MSDTLEDMNEKSSSSEPEPSQPRPEGPARGALRKQLQEVFPDLDPDRVAQVLGLDMSDEGEK